MNDSVLVKEYRGYPIGITLHKSPHFIEMTVSDTSVLSAKAHTSLVLINIVFV